LDVQFERPVKELRIWGEAAKIEAVRDHLFHDLIFPAALAADWITIDDRPEFQIGDTTISWRRQEHPGGSVAYRLDWPQQGKRLVYATDTTGDVSETHAKWSANADLLMHECYFRDSAKDWALKTGHSWTSRVAEVASKCEPAKLLLTHINPLEMSQDPVDIESIRRRVASEVILATDGLTLDF
jgi:ribonuclease BN (tRNA processing enzyme)